MRLTCPKCGEQVDPTAAAEDGRVYCGRCQARLKLPPAVAVPEPTAVPMAQALLLPIPIPTDPPEYVREKVEDLRDRRDDRRERRQYEREDRVGNPVGLAGAGLTGTALLLVISGGVFSSALPAYGWFAALLGLMATLLGLPLAIIGALKPGRSRAVSIAGAVAGGLLILILIPALMLVLTQKK